MNTETNPTQTANHLMTIQEMIADPIFIKNVGTEIDSLRAQRISRKNPGPGYRYKRDWYDRLTEAQQFNETFFLENIEAIWLKQSSLTSAIRPVIEHVCGLAVQSTLAYYAAITAEKEVIE